MASCRHTHAMQPQHCHPCPHRTSQRQPETQFGMGANLLTLKLAHARQIIKRQQLATAAHKVFRLPNGSIQVVTIRQPENEQREFQRS
ncbi:hypothetical protein [Kingella oralis]|uniref:hypothetical protein n=1 Tax=Kingella oralis TaxID=505 RepID=UPI0034E3D0D3